MSIMRRIVEPEDSMEERKPEEQKSQDEGTQRESFSFLQETIKPKPVTGGQIADRKSVV